MLKKRTTATRSSAVAKQYKGKEHATKEKEDIHYTNRYQIVVPETEDCQLTAVLCALDYLEKMVEQLMSQVQKTNSSLGVGKRKHTTEEQPDINIKLVGSILEEYAFILQRGSLPWQVKERICGQMGKGVLELCYKLATWLIKVVKGNRSNTGIVIKRDRATTTKSRESASPCVDDQLSVLEKGLYIAKRIEEFLFDRYKHPSQKEEEESNINNTTTSTTTNNRERAKLSGKKRTLGSVAAMTTRIIDNLGAKCKRLVALLSPEGGVPAHYTGTMPTNAYISILLLLSSSS